MFAEDFLEWDDAELERRKRLFRMGAFSPDQTAKISGWLRLQASSQSGGEWTPSIVDVLNAGSPAVQTDTDRRAAVGVTASGLPTMVFDGSDVHLWPTIPAHASTSKLGFWIWYKPGTVTGFQTLYSVVNGVGGSTNKRLIIYANGATVQFRAYRDNFNGRIGTTPSVLTAGVWSAIYCAYDFAQTGDAKIAVYVGGAAQSLTMTDDGAGGYGTGLPAADGSATLGAETDSDTPTRPIANGGEFGPNPVISFNDNLTAGEIANMLTFEVPN